MPSCASTGKALQTSCVSGSLGGNRSSATAEPCLPSRAARQSQAIIDRGLRFWYIRDKKFAASIPRSNKASAKREDAAGCFLRDSAAHYPH
jgi:hypothetical protein